MGIFGFILMLTLILLGIMNGTRLGAFIDVPSFLITFGVSVFMLLACYGSGVTRAIRVVFSKTNNEESLVQGIAVFQRWQSLAVVVGVTGTIVGLVNMLQALDDPEALGPGTATALITTV